MKNTEISPKCQANDIVRIPGKVGAYGVGNNIIMGVATFNAIKVTRYLCGTCGFSEEWIDDRRDLEKLKNKCK